MTEGEQKKNSLMSYQCFIGARISNIRQHHEVSEQTIQKDVALWIDGKAKNITNQLTAR